MSCLFLSHVGYCLFSDEELPRDRASLASSNSESSADEDIHADMFGDDGGFEREEEEGPEEAEPALAREYIMKSTHLQNIVEAQKVQYVLCGCGCVVWVCGCAGVYLCGHVWVFLPL